VENPNPAMTTTRPLDGLQVVDLSRLLPGPYLTMTLADLGADVIKVEPLGGGDWVRWVPPVKSGMSAQFMALNRGKRSVCLNLKKPQGVEVIKRLVATADAVVESFRPGVMDRLGLGYEVLRAINPALVYVAITGYGQTGPMRSKAGHDLNYTALSGALALTGDSDGPPVMPGFQLADVAGGGLFGAVALLAGIHECRKTGRGRFIDLSLTEGAMAFNVLTMASHLATGDALGRGTDRLGGGAACYQVYETADGRHISLAALEPKFFMAFCDAIGRTEWKSRHMGDDDALKVDLAALFRTKTRDEWTRELAEFDVCVEPVLELHEVGDHPQHVARNVFFELQQSGDQPPVRMMRSPILDAEQTAHIGPAPGMGQHTVDVLEGAGFTETEIAELRIEHVCN
jgi:alpha-methylacyl-CoA racemase